MASERKIAHPFRAELNQKERYIPDVWSREYVASRMLMAAQTLKNMSTGRIAPAGFSSAFPEFEKEWDGLLKKFDQLPEDPPENLSELPTNEDITLMEEALTWPIEYLRGSVNIATSVTLWVASDVYGVPKKFYADKKKITEYYFRKNAMHGFDKISEGLTLDGVRIR